MSSPSLPGSRSSAPGWLSEVLKDVEHLSVRVVERLRGELDVYASLEETQLEEVRTIAAWCVRRVLESWDDTAELSAADLELLRGIGAARALDGRPLVHVLRAYRIAGHVVTDAVVERAAGELDAVDAITLARLWMTALDQITDALVTGHQAASRHLEDSTGHGVELLVQDLLIGRNVTPAALRARAERLGLGMPAQVGLLCTLESVDPALLVTFELEIENGTGGERLPASPVLAATVTDAGGTTLVHPGLVAPGAAAAWLAGLALRSPGEQAPAWAFAVCAPSDLRRTRRAVQTALPMAPPHAWLGRPFLDLVDVHALLLAVGSPSGSGDVLSAALPEQVATDPVLVATLDAYLATANANEAARLLGCHPQSVRQRMRRIHALCGRDLRSAWDRYVLESARVNARRSTSGDVTVGERR